MPTAAVTEIPVDVPVEQIATPDAGALKAVQDVLTDMRPADAPPIEIAPVPAEKPADAPPAGAPPPDAPPADAPPGDKPAEAPPPADAPPADAPAARPSDEFGELPKDVKAETRERFDAMRTRYDEVHTRAERAEATNQQWIDTISSAGTPEQFGEALQVVRDVNESTPESWKRAYETLTRQAGILAKALGMPAAGYDPLDEHPDLKKRVEDSVDFTREDALQIAQARKQGAMHDTASQRTAQVNDQRAAHDRGVADVGVLGNELRAANGAEFQAKLPYLTPIINNAIASLPPDKWVGAIRKAYADIPVPAAPAPPPPPPSVPNPLRPSGSGSTNVDKKPTSALEAVQLSLARKG